MMNSTIKNNTSWGRDLNAKKRDENLNRVVQKTPQRKWALKENMKYIKDWATQIKEWQM